MQGIVIKISRLLYCIKTFKSRVNYSGAPQYARPWDKKQILRKAEEGGYQLESEGDGDSPFQWEGPIKAKDPEGEMAVLVRGTRRSILIQCNVM